MSSLIKSPISRIIKPVIPVVGGDIPAGFKATDIPGNVFWVDGFQGIELDGDGKGTGWLDGSGFGNNLAQPVSIRRPLYVAPTPFVIPGFLFDQDDEQHLQAPNSASLQWANEVSFFFVYNVTVSSFFGTLLTKGDLPTAGNIGYDGVSKKFDLRGNGIKIVSNAPITAGINRILVITKGAGTRRLRIDGVDEVASFTDTDLLNNSGALTIAGLLTGAGAFDGVISSVGIYNRVITNNEVDELEAGLAGRYGITI